MLTLFVSFLTFIATPHVNQYALPVPVEVRERVKNKKRSRTNRKR